MEVKASLRYLRMSPKKVRLVADMVRGMDVQQALIQLQFSKKTASHQLEKLLRSALANATNNAKLEEEGLYIKTIAVDQGPTLKRWRARAFGRSAPIRKRTAHISLVLDQNLGQDESVKIPAKDEAAKKAPVKKQKTSSSKPQKNTKSKDTKKAKASQS